VSTIHLAKKGDLFLSADKFDMDNARKLGLVAEVIPVVVQWPVLIVSVETKERLEKQGKPVTGLKDLLRDDLKVITALPERAAIGRTIKNILSDPKIDLWSQLEKARLHGTNRVSNMGTVNEIVTAVRTGHNAIGLVWKPIAEATAGLAIIPVPELEQFQEMAQIGVLNTAHGEQATAALQFARFLTARDQGLEYFKKHHFTPVPDADLWDEHPEIHLSAGAMLKPGIEDAIKAFAQREGVTIHTSFAGCGVLVSQMKGIKHGEKAGKFPDAYFACDTEFLQKVQEWFDAGVIVSSNDMVLIVQKGNPRHIHKLEDLGKADLRIGLCDPDKSALGKLSEDLLKKTGLHAQVFTPDWRESGRVVLSEAGHDLINKMRVGALDVVIAYRSNALSNPENPQKYMDVVNIDIPDALARQPFAIAKDSTHKYLMQRLLHTLVAKQTEDRFKQLGFKWVYDGN
jgi:ABC-type molybdate transport system substrate-binding protein